MTSIYPNDMRTFIRLGRAEALLFVQHASDVLHSSNELWMGPVDVVNVLVVRSPNISCNPRIIQTVCTRVIVFERSNGQLGNNKIMHIIWYNQRRLYQRCEAYVKQIWVSANRTDWMCSPMRTNKNLPTLPDLWCKHLIICWGNTSPTLEI